MKYFLALFCSVFYCIGLAQMSGPEVVDKSIMYHDPTGAFQDKVFDLQVSASRPNGETRITEITIDLYHELFEVKRNLDGVEAFIQMKSDSATTLLDGSANMPDSLRKKYRLNKDGALLWKNYYEYIWLLPMKLKDPGTTIHEGTETVDFFGQNLIQVKITYTPEVGEDIWYFYFDPSTYAMKGYRFYHDEAANDGEYILLTGEIQSGDVRLPKERAWYTHKKDTFLGKDIVEALEVR